MCLHKCILYIHDRKGPHPDKKGGRSSPIGPLPVRLNAMYYQLGFWVRFGFFMISVCGIGKRYIFSFHWRDTFLRT